MLRLQICFVCVIMKLVVSRFLVISHTTYLKKKSIAVVYFRFYWDLMVLVLVNGLIDKLKLSMKPFVICFSFCSDYDSPSCDFFNPIISSIVFQFPVCRRTFDIIIYFISSLLDGLSFAGYFISNPRVHLTWAPVFRILIILIGLY